MSAALNAVTIDAAISVVGAIVDAVIKARAQGASTVDLTDAWNQASSEEGAHLAKLDADIAAAKAGKGEQL